MALVLLSAKLTSSASDLVGGANDGFFFSWQAAARC
jgi:hypothetical protein